MLTSSLYNYPIKEILISNVSFIERCSVLNQTNQYFILKKIIYADNTRVN